MFHILIWGAWNLRDCMVGSSAIVSDCLRIGASVALGRSKVDGD